MSIEPRNPGGDAGGGDADQIAAGLGGATLYGNEGDDKIGTANDNPQADLAGIANHGFYRYQAPTRSSAGPAATGSRAGAPRTRSSPAARRQRR